MQNPESSVVGGFAMLGMAHIQAMRDHADQVSHQLQVDADVAAVRRLGRMLTAERQRVADLERQLCEMTARAVRAEVNFVKATNSLAKAVSVVTVMKKARSFGGGLLVAAR